MTSRLLTASIVRPLLAGLLVLASVAEADPTAETLSAQCPSGLPKSDVQGRPLDWAAWRPTPVLAVIWSPDCAFCQRHNAKLDALLREFPDAAVIGIAVDSPPEAVMRAVKRRGYSFPVIADGTGRCAVRPQLTPRRVIPMTCWLGEAPTQPRCIPGEMSDDDLRDLLKVQARSKRHS
jgi:thiol-disulfide isomerase/thioredoxin